MAETFVLYADGYFNKIYYHLVRNAFSCKTVILPGNCNVDDFVMEVEITEKEFLRLFDTFNKIKELYYDPARFKWI